MKKKNVGFLNFFTFETNHGFILNSYRKALKMMYYADHYGSPIITFINTSGAYVDLKSKRLGQVYTQP